MNATRNFLLRGLSVVNCEKHFTDPQRPSYSLLAFSIWYLLGILQSIYRPLEYLGENMQVKAFNVIPL